MEFRLFVHGWTLAISVWRNSSAFRSMLKEMQVVMYSTGSGKYIRIYRYLYSLTHSTRTVDVDVHIS